MSARAYCDRPSIRDHWTLRCMSRCPDQVVSVKRDLQCLRLQASLVLIYGHTASLVYADKPQTLDHLEDNIRRVIADIRPQMLEKVIENWTSRLDYIRASRGSPMPEIIFKM
ncbi:hypothetical protein TNCV_3155551 [Trichonephila clavipes]|nr:hypothetical protein TNCV_3155551 [Trichonephila clavipes]